MQFLSKKKYLLGAALFLILLAGIPLTIGLMNKPQETRSRASGSTSLSFVPTSSTSAPLQKNVGDDITLDLMVDPGANLVTFLRLQVSYDSTKLQLTTDPFTVNTSAFPVTVEGPVTSTNGLLSQSVSIGSDPTKVIQTVTKVGTVHFKAIGNTGNTPTNVGFTSLNQALSAGAGDQAAENVLSTTKPALILIGGTSTTSGTPKPTGTTTSISLTILLHGIGTSGDSPNPDTSDLSNKNPLHPQRNLEVQIFDSNNQLVVVSSASAIVYKADNGAFLGSVDLGQDFVTGNYNLKIKTGRYLRKLVPGIQRIVNLESNAIPSTALIAGDVNSDNVLNILDYNALLDCGYGAIKPLPMEDPNSLFRSTNCQSHQPAELIDIDDNGIVNSPDFNLFLRELSVQNGD